MRRLSQLVVLAGLLTASCGGPAASSSAGVEEETTATSATTATTATTATPVRPLEATTTTTKPPASGDPTAVLVGLRVAPEGPRTGYRRELFNHWVDADRDGCDTREEVLIAESRSTAQVDPYVCKVLEGDWYSLYDGLTFTDPAELDIDHMVPLAEAWDSGAANWDAGRRQSFANDLYHQQALRAVSASSNRSKGDLDPGQWKPTRDNAWCEYANDWVTAKKAWDLTADQNEVDDLRVMLRTCGQPALQSGTPSTTATTAKPATTTTTGAPHTYRFPAGYTLAPGASVTIRSGGPAGPGELAWTNQNVWNNTGDTAYLVNAGGAVVSTKTC